MKKEDYILGLDLGVGSVGWSCMRVDKDCQPCRLIDANSYIFPEEKGDMAERRTARALRRLIRRRKGRVQKVKHLFIEHNYLDAAYIKSFYNTKVANYDNPYQLKCKGLQEKLLMDELFICLIHYAKYRGFQSNRKIKEQAKSTASATEEQKLLFSIEQTQKALDEKGYTISQYITHDPKFKDKIKNTDGAYHVGITRKMIVDEATMLLDKQVEFGLIDEAFKKEYINTLTYQRSFSDGPNEPSPYAHPLTKMIGVCKFDGEKRCPSTAPSYELFVLIQKLQSIRYYEKGTRKEQSLNKEEISQIIDIALKGTEIKYKTIYKMLGRDITFKGITLTRKEYAEIYKENIQNPEKSLEQLCFEKKLEYSVYQMKSMKYLQNALKKLGQPSDDLKLLDEIADLLSKYKSDAEIEKFIKEYPLLSQQSDLFQNAVLNLDETKFKQFGKLSFAVIYKLLPLMKDQNMMYSEAMNALGYDHAKEKKNEAAYSLLPPLEVAFKKLEKSVTNRAAIATLQEAKKIINALISTYGKPKAIHVELARELCKTPKERYDILDKQLNKKMDTMNIKMQIVNKYSYIFDDIAKVHHDDIVKYRLYMEQGGIDPYTLAMTGSEDEAKINEKDLFDRDYEIDHILPYSKSFNDTMSNKVLVRAKMNQEKGNRVPREFFQNAKGFNKYVEWTQKLRDMKKRENLMVEKITEEMLEDFSARSLNDTRYATRVLCDILRYYFPDVKIRSFTGQITAKLKGIWGLNGYTHSYHDLNYKIKYDEDKELTNLQKELSMLTLDQSEDKDRIAKLKKAILDHEKTKNQKDRSNHLHHALDATVIACATDSLRKRIEIHEQKLRQESQNIKNFRIPMVHVDTGEFYGYEMKQIISMDYDTYYDMTKNLDPKHFPKPYPQFHDEIILRIFERNVQVLRQKLCAFSNYTPDEIQQVHPIYIAHKCDKKESGRLHKATFYGVASHTEKENAIVLTNRIRINSEKFNSKLLNKLYDKNGTQKEVYHIVKEWLGTYKNGREAYVAHNNQYPIHKNGNSIQKVKIDYDEPKEEICIHKGKQQYVEKENVIQIHVYKKEGSNRLYFIGMDRYRVMNYKNDPSIRLWWGQAKNYIDMKYSELAKQGFTLYRKLYKNQIIDLILKNGNHGLCIVVGFSSGMLEIGSELGDISDILYDGLQTKIKDRLQITVSTIKDIEIVHMDILGNIRR